jgi:hypothetical protein
MKTTPLAVIIASAVSGTPVPSILVNLIGRESAHRRGGSLLALTPSVQADTLTSTTFHNVKASGRDAFLTAARF